MLTPTLFSPTQCAKGLTEDLLDLALRTQMSLPDRRELMVQLVRQLVRQNLEFCASLAEDWSTEHDPRSLMAEQVGDCIAEAIRRHADERGRGR
jgi:hypothetical protein